MIEIYCDGGCRGNKEVTNIGGWGAVLLHESRKLEIYGGELNTTNNRMEITAVIKALEKVKCKKYNIKVYIDSAYVLNGITKWVKNWKKNGWITGSKKSPVKNKELWVELDDLVSTFPPIEFIKVKGHSGVEYNELADQLANRGMDELKINLN